MAEDENEREFHETIDQLREYKSMLEQLNFHPLKDRERIYIDSFRVFLVDAGFLTDKQERVLMDIYNRYIDHSTHSME